MDHADNLLSWTGKVIDWQMLSDGSWWLAFDTENRDRGRAKPNAQAALLIRMVA